MIETFLSVDKLPKLSNALLKSLRRRETAIMQITDVFGDPELLLKYYVPPLCQHHNPADEDEDGKSAAIDISKSAFAVIDKFLSGDLQIRDGRTQLFILSDAGMGKTSLLMMIKFHHLMQFFPSRFDCVLLKLGEDTLGTVQAIEDKGNTILLLDALDEDKTAWGHIQQRIADLLHATQHFHRVIISCRTQFFPEKELDPFKSPGEASVSGFRCPLMFLSLFDDEHVEAFLHKKYPNHWYQFSWQQRAERQQAWGILEQMNSLRFRPLLLVHIDDLLKKSERRAWNAYSVYQAMVEAWLDREERKFSKFKLSPSPEPVEGEKKDKPAKSPTREDLLRACIHVAAWMQKKGERGISESALNTLVRVVDKDIAYLEHFNFGGRALLNRNSAKEFRFSHYSIQEFLVAHGAVLEMFSLQEVWQDMRLSDALMTFLQLAPWTQEQLKAGWRQDKLKDGGFAPSMVLIRGGRFRMGGTKEKYEKPIHDVSMPSFLIGKYPVTFAEYDVFCEATQRDKPNDEGWGREQRPVINVTWNDAVAYCKWLSEQTGTIYRLPSEAEWEYACRAGSEGNYCFGSDIARLKDYAWYTENSDGKTHPVGKKQPNAWGLHDVHGNVWEWCQDTWHENYKGAPVDGSAWVVPVFTCCGAVRGTTILSTAVLRIATAATVGATMLGFVLCVVLRRGLNPLFF